MRIFLLFYKMTTVEVFRHDARMDCDEAEKQNVDRTYDPPLSTAGVTHAELVSGRPGDIIVSSPLLRCVQSAIPWLQGRPLILDARFMEKVIPLDDFKFRTDDELPQAFYIRTAHGLPTGDDDFREAIQEYAEKANRAGIKNVQIFTHGVAIETFAAMLGKEVYSTEYGCSVTGIYNGTWEFVSSNDVGLASSFTGF